MWIQILWILVWTFVGNYSNSFSTTHPIPIRSHSSYSTGTNRYDRIMMCDDDSDDEMYMYMEENISSVLTRKPKTEIDNDCWMMIDAHTGMIRWSDLESLEDFKNTTPDDRIPMMVLIELAHQCDVFLFTSSSCLFLSENLYAFLRMVNPYNSSTKEEQIVIATLMVCNQMELQLGEKTIPGKAPLLKELLYNNTTHLPTMFQHTLCTLLLPQNGLNLRNLLWHGFVCTLPRRWFSLCLLLTHNLQQLTNKKEIKPGNDKDYTKLIPTPQLDTSMVYPENGFSSLNVILKHGNELYKSIIMQQKQQKDNNNDDGAIVEQLSQILPVTHRSLFYVACKHYMEDCPIVFSSIVSVLLEHALRVQYSRNDNHDKMIARENEYYVTLDGHGQRHKHELLLHPSETNMLISILGAPLVAILTDFFASPFDHNIRSTMAHGTYNSYLFRELQHYLKHPETKSPPNSGLIKFTFILLAIYDLMSWKLIHPTFKSSSTTSSSSAHQQKMILEKYKPMYSYTAVTLQNLNNALNQLEQLSQYTINNHHSSPSSSACISFPSVVTLQQIKQKIQSVFINQQFMFDYNDTMKPLNLYDLISHQKCNQCLQSCSASRLLFEEASHAISKIITDIKIREDSLQLSSSSRKRKQYQRVLQMVQISFDFYALIVYIGILSIESVFREEKHIPMNINVGNHENQLPLSQKDLLRAVERSRMCQSTYSTFLHTNIDRAIKAIDQYQKGKIFKSILSHLLKENEL